MNYCKITTTGAAHMMPNPVQIIVANPTDQQKVLIAELGGWLPMVYTDEPDYDPDTQYVTDYWAEEDGKAVQQWVVHELPEPEPTIEDRVDNLEGAVDGIISGETE